MQELVAPVAAAGQDAGALVGHWHRRVCCTIGWCSDVEELEVTLAAMVAQRMGEQALAMRVGMEGGMEARRVPVGRAWERASGAAGRALERRVDHLRE